MSGTQVSSFGNASQNTLFDPLMARRQTALDSANQNALLEQQQHQQAIGAQELEVGARVASALLSLPAEQRAEAYPRLVGMAQTQGFMKQAPPSYPGDDHARALAQMGVPSEKLYGERANLTANAAIWPPRGATPGAAAAPGAGTGMPAAPGQIEQPAQDRARAVYDGLIKRGADHDTAVGFAANALHESAANPNTGTGDAGASHGLFQWTRDRYDAYIAKNGHPPDNAPLDEQLDFVLHELGGSESLARGRIAAAQGPEGKAAEISQAYLRPKDTVPEMQRRAATARQLAGLWTPNATAQQGDEVWLTEMAKRYPSLAGPNTNVNQPATADQTAAGGPATPAPYQVAGAPVAPPGTAVGASAAAPAPAVPPATPAPTAQATPPAAPAPAAPAIPPPAQRTATGYTTEQNAVLDAMAKNPRTTSEALRAQMNTFNDDNRALDAQHLAAQNQAQTGQRADQAHAETVAEHARQAAHQAQADKLAAEAAARDAQRLELTKGEHSLAAEKWKAEQDKTSREVANPFGNSETGLLRYYLSDPANDPKSSLYHAAWAAYANPQTVNGITMPGHVMEPFRMPLDADGVPVTTYDKPKMSIGPGDLTKYRAFVEQAATLKVSLKEFADTSRKAGAVQIGLTMAGAPTDLASSWTNAALLAKGEALFQLGVLSGPDMTVIRGALADPKTIFGGLTSTDTIDKQVARINRILDTRLEAAREAYGGGMSIGAAPSSAPPASDRPPLSSFQK